MKVNEQLAIMAAYASKRPIEVKNRLYTLWEDLPYSDNYNFDFVNYEYRIKEKPKYRLFKTVEEAFNEAKKHGFWARERTKKYLRMITIFDCDKLGKLQLIDGYCASYFLDNFVWADDGSPCGIKIN